MDREKFKIELFSDFFKLIHCALSPKPVFEPNEIVADYDEKKWIGLRSQSRYCGIEGLIFSQIENTQLVDQFPGIYEQWKSESDEIAYKNLMFRVEVDKLIKAYKDVGFDCVQIKGDRIVECFDDVCMRKTNDIDLLINADCSSDRDKIVNATEALGYSTDMALPAKNFTFVKKPIYYLETHFELFSDNDGRVFEHFCNPWKFYSIDGDSSSRNAYFSMSSTNEFVYLLCHGFHHYDNRGMSIRWLLDSFAYYLKYSESIDLVNVVVDINNLGYANYFDICQNLYKNLVTSWNFDSLSHSEVAFVEDCLISGRQGKIELLVEKEIAKSGKWKFIKSRLWPNAEELKGGDDFAYRHKWIRPIYPVYRLFRTLSRKDKSIKSKLGREIKALIKRN